MQQVLVNIENKELEDRLLLEANRTGRELSSIITDILETNFREKEEAQRRYRNLDPNLHMTRISFDIDETENPDEAAPFKEVGDSAAYVRELRKNTWREN